MKLKRGLPWLIAIVGAMVLTTYVVRIGDREVFGPGASMVDMIAGVASEVQRQPHRNTFMVYRYADASALRRHWIHRITAGLLPNKIVGPSARCDVVYYGRVERKLSHGRGTDGPHGVTLFKDHVFVNVSPETLYAVAKEKGDWCSFGRHGCTEESGCYDYQPSGNGDVWGCCPG